MQEKYLIPLSILFSAIILGVGIYFTNSENNKIKEEIVKNNSDKSKYSVKRVDPETDHIRGSKNAEIFIIEYSDLECLGCKTFSKIKNNIVEKYKDNSRVAFVDRHFPLYKTLGGGEPLHPTSGIEARATECVAKLAGEEKFYEMKEKIFKTTKSDGLYPVENLSILAEGVGVDQKQFEECISSQEIIDKIENAWQDAYDAGIEATPAVFVQIKSSDKIFKATPGKDIIENAIESYLNSN